MVQLPPQFNALSLPDVDQAIKRNEYNALRNDAQRQSNESQEFNFDIEKKTRAAQAFSAIGRKGQEELQRDPNAWSVLLPEVVKTFQDLGLPIDKIPPAGASPDEVMEGLIAMQRNGDMFLSTQGSQDPSLVKDAAGYQRFAGGPNFGERAFPDAQIDPRQATAAPAKIQQAEWWNSATPEQRAGYMSANYAGKVQDIGGVPHWVMPGGESVPLSTLENETQGESTIAAGVAGAKTGASAEETRLQGIITQGQEVADGLPVLRRSLELLDTVKTGGVITEAQLALAKKLGVETADQGELSANLGKAVLSQLRETFGAQFTEAEGQRLIAIEAGFGKNNDTNRRLLGQAIAIVEAKANRAIKLARDRGDEATAQIIEEMMNMSLSQDDFQSKWDAAESGTVLEAPDGTMRKKP